MVDRPSQDHVPPVFQSWIDEIWDKAPEDFRAKVNKIGLVAAAVRNIERDDPERERDSWCYPNLLKVIDPKCAHGHAFLRAGLRDSDPEIAMLSVKWLPEYIADPGELRLLLVDCLQHSVPAARYWAALHLSLRAPDTIGLPEVLVEALQVDWPATRRREREEGVRGPGAAAEALARLGERGKIASPVLRRLLDRAPTRRSRWVDETTPTLEDLFLMLRAYRTLGADPEDVLHPACALLAACVSENLEPYVPLDILRAIEPDLDARDGALRYALYYLAFVLSAGRENDRYDAIELLRSLPAAARRSIPLLWETVDKATDQGVVDASQQAWDAIAVPASTVNENAAEPRLTAVAGCLPAELQFVLGTPSMTAPWRIHQAAFSADGQLLACPFEEQGAIVLVDTARREIKLHHENTASTFAFVPGKPWLLASHNRNFTIFNYEGKELAPVHDWEAPDVDVTSHLTVSSNGRWLVSQDLSDVVKLWDMRGPSPSLRATFPGRSSGQFHPHPPAVMNPSGSRLVVGEPNGDLSLWDLANDSPEKLLQWSLGESWPRPSRVAMGRQAFIATASERHCCLWKVEGAAVRLLHTLRCGPVCGLTFLSCNNHLVVVGERGSVYVMEPTSGAIVHSLQLPGRVHTVAFAPYGTSFLVEHGNDCFFLYRFGAELEDYKPKTWRHELVPRDGITPANLAPARVLQTLRKIFPRVVVDRDIGSYRLGAWFQTFKERGATDEILEQVRQERRQAIQCLVFADDASSAVIDFTLESRVVRAYHDGRQYAWVHRCAEALGCDIERNGSSVDERESPLEKLRWRCIRATVRRMTEFRVSFENAEGLFIAQSSAWRIRVRNLVVTPFGVEAQFDFIPTPGLALQDRAPPGIQWNWSELSCTRQGWFRGPFIVESIWFGPPVKAVVEYCQSHEGLLAEPLSRNEIDRLMGQNRRDDLARFLNAHLRLFWRDEFVGVVTDHDATRLPLMHGSFRIATPSMILRESLEWSNADEAREERRLDETQNDEDGDLNWDAPMWPFEETLLDEWWLQSVHGSRIDLSLIPRIDFKKGSITWYFACVAGVDLSRP